MVKLLISLVEGVDLGEGRRLPGLPWVLEREVGRQGPPPALRGPAGGDRHPCDSEWQRHGAQPGGPL